MAETAQITPVVGWNTVTVASPVLLPAGAYWLAYLPSSNALGFRTVNDSVSSGRWYAFTYGTMPGTFSTAPTAGTHRWSFYATLDTGAAPLDNIAPSVPDNLTAVAASATQINLAWAASTDNTAVSGYQLERCQGAGCSAYTLIATQVGTTYADAGRTSNTSYSYRVRAIDTSNNSSGYSNMATVVTPVVDTTAPSTPSGLAANAVSNSQIDLIWNPATDNVGVTAYRVYRCTGTKCTPNSEIAQTPTPSYSDTGLNTTTTYRYRVRAVDAANNLGANSAIVTRATLAAADTTPPTAPGNLAAVASGINTINLSWTASTDNVAVSGYRVERCQGAGCTNFTQVAVSTGTTAVDSNSVANTAYSYRVAATDGAGNVSGFSNTASATTLNPDTSPPSTPASLAAIVVSSSRINLSWVASSDNVAVNGYRVERCQGGACSGFVQVGTAIGGSYADSGLLSNTSYSYRVLATDTAGNLSGYSNVSSTATLSADTTAPVAPAGLSANALSATQISVAWAASTDDVGVTGYQLERCQGAGCFTFTPVASQTGINFNDAGLTANTSYSYRVRATDAAGNWSNYSNVATVSTPIVDTTAPSVPTGLTAVAVSNSQIDLSWVASTDNVGVTGYQILRCTGSNCTPNTQVGTSTSTTYSDTGLATSTTYRYRVRAVDAAGNVSGISARVTRATLAESDTSPPAAPSGLAAITAGAAVSLSWAAATDNVGVTGYELERCQGESCTAFILIASQAALAFTDASVVASTSYSYRVRARDLAGNIGNYSNVVSITVPAPDTTAPSAPTLTAAAVSATQINLNWSGATDNVAVTGYRLERCQGAGCASFAQIAVTAGLLFNDTGRTANTSYSYRIVAMDAADNQSPYSNVASATTGSAPETITMRETGILATADSGNGNMLMAQRSTLAKAATVQSLSFYVTTAGGNLRLGIYDASGPGGGPGAKLAETGEMTPISGWNTANVLAPVSLQAGTYWLAYLPSSNSLGFRNANDAASSGKWYAFSYGTMPAIFSTTPAGGTYRWSFFATLNIDAVIIDTAAPSSPGLLAAVAASSSSVNLSWSASTDNVAVTGYQLERCQGTGCTNFLQIAAPTGTNYSDNNLATGVNYQYRARAIDATGNLSGYSNLASITLQDTTAPTVPSNLLANPAGATLVYLSWGSATDDVSVASYQLERCQGAACTNFVQISAISGTIYADTGRLPNTSYRYRVRAADAAGNLSDYSNVASAATSGSVLGLVAAYPLNEGAGTSTVDVSGNNGIGQLHASTWTTSGQFGNALIFDGNSSFVDLGSPPTLQMNSDMSVSAWIKASAFSLDDTAIVSKRGGATVQGFQLETTQASGNRTIGFRLTNDNGEAVVRYGATTLQANQWYYVTGVYDATNRTIDLYVNGLLDNGPLQGVITGAQQDSPLNVYIGQRPGLAGSVFDGSIDEVRIYSRPLIQTEVQADMMTPLGDLPPIADTTPPTAPVILNIAPASGGLNLNWSVSTDDVAIIGYQVERCEGTDCNNFALIAVLNSLNYNDTGLLPLTSYRYRLRSTDAAGNFSAYSDIVSGTTQAIAPVVTLSVSPDGIAGGGSSVLNWSVLNANTCVASDGWTGSRAVSGTESTGPLVSSTTYTLTCTGAGGTAAASATVVVTASTQTYGLEWPGDGSVRRMLYWHNPFPIYDATYVFKVYPRKKSASQNGNTYYTTFFWGNDGPFAWFDYNGRGDRIGNTYYGAHPYPVPSPNGPGQWEISVYSNDYVTGSEVQWDRWYTQAFRAWRESPSITHHEFYYDLPDLTKVIRQTFNDPNWAQLSPPTPAIVVGQAPNLNGQSWGGYPGWEEFNGIIRGMQIYSGLLSVSDILTEIAAPKSTAAGANLIWYLNLNPRPGDVSDKKGIGIPNNPVWDGEPAFEWVE